MQDKTYEPKYQCWVEKDFLSDRAVMRMTWLQRHFYRALLQGAFNIATRPYLPADDQLLCEIADAESLDQWVANKGPVLAKFQLHTAEDGSQLWAHKRILSDWAQVLDYVAKKGKAGKARHYGSPSAEQNAAPAGKPKVLKGKVKENENENETVTETEPAPVFGAVKGSERVPSTLNLPSDADGSGGTTTDPVEDHIGVISNTWASLYDRPAETTDVASIIQRFYDGNPVKAGTEVRNLLAWTSQISNHWGPDKNNLRSTDDLLRNFAEIRRQWSVYMEKARAGIGARAAMRDVPPTPPVQPEAGSKLVDDAWGDDEFGSFQIFEEELED